MGELWNRSFALNLGGTRVASETVDGARNELLRVTFKVEASLAKAVNTAAISVYNLAETTRAKVAVKGIATTLEAGYSGRSSQIFGGKLEAGKSAREGVDWVTSFQSTDGGQQLRAARINLSFKKVSATQAFERVAGTLGLGLGNAVEKMRQGNIRGALEQFENGIVLSGPSQRELDRLARTFGYDWSVQNGQLQLLGPTDAIEPGDAIVLNSDTGMIGSPESGEKGIVEVRSLLIPQLTPGRVVVLEARRLSGNYRVEKVTFQGDTRGKDWYADLELKPR
jgi:hypothetical protein